MLNFIRRHKVITGLIILNFVVLIIVISTVVLHHAKTATIDINVAPSEAIIEINGSKFDNFQYYDVMPGDYHAKISMEGMQTKELDFHLAEGELERLWTYLLDDNGGLSYYANHLSDMKILEVFADEDPNIKTFLEKYKKLLAIDSVLPLTYSNTFENDANDIVSIYISWGDTDDCGYDNMCLIVDDYTGDNHDKALSMIRDAGFSPDDYIITFREGGEK